MQFILGTGGLRKQYNYEYEKILFESIDKGLPIHTSLDYINIKQYFYNSFKNNNKEPKLVIKIFINKNPIKKIINIKKQIQNILDFYKIRKIHILQICNNPKNNFVNYLLLEKNLNNFKKNNIFDYAYFDTYYDFNKNLITYINNKSYDGYISTYNLFKKGITNNFFNQIKLSNKKIISISPVNGGQVDNAVSVSDLNTLNNIAKNNNCEDLSYLSILYLKSLGINGAVMGTKNYKRYKDIINFINYSEILKENDISKIKDINNKIKYFNNY